MTHFMYKWRKRTFFLRGLPYENTVISQDRLRTNVSRKEDCPKKERPFLVFCRACEKLGVADNTYFFYSSDHGFQLGEVCRHPHYFSTLLVHTPFPHNFSTLLSRTTNASVRLCGAAQFNIPMDKRQV